MSGLYIHIPFCKQACHYCDFHFSTQLRTEDPLIAAICKEIAMRKDFLEGKNLGTIYFGGGTPSVITNKNLSKIFVQIKEMFSIVPSAEITIEANPDDISEMKLAQWKELGINRLSIGIQSFRDRDLKYMNRAHNSRDSLRCIKLAKDYGYDNISIDLIYGIPEMGLEVWKDNLYQAVDLDIAHISAYCLTIEPNTVFGKWHQNGKMNPPIDDEVTEQFYAMREILCSAGFDHYEISNFSKEGFVSNHNSNYWKGQSYLGIGPSAHSYNHDFRIWNVSNNHQYINALKSNDAFFEHEQIDVQKAYNEYVLTGLRTKWGIDLNYVSDNFKIDIKKAFENELNSYREYFLVAGDHLKLNENGWLLADKISSDLFLA